MDKTYISSKHLVFQLIFVGFPLVVCLFLLYWVVQSLLKVENTDTILVPLVLLSLFLFISYRTIRAYQKAHYRLDDEYLHYQCGWSKGKIRLQTIKSVTPSSYPSAGIRPALDFRGVQIVHGEGYSLFISPDNRSEFIKHLQARIGEARALEN
ncbi:MAG: PH domain-containing protein [Saprospiraceae bacterium]|nr:PH domain-containing protein [Saprospiraceae bacterium]